MHNSTISPFFVWVYLYVLVLQVISGGCDVKNRVTTGLSWGRGEVRGLSNRCCLSRELCKCSERLLVILSPHYPHRDCVRMLLDYFPSFKNKVNDIALAVCVSAILSFELLDI